jgi:hypothetical protein
VDKDGDLDIVVANYGGQNMVYKNNGDSTAWSGIPFQTSYNDITSLALYH